MGGRSRVAGVELHVDERMRFAELSKPWDKKLVGEQRR
jgi:hypothetical protein